ncbi:methyltransferase, FxLD system [Streptomyces sp. PT12]|uniref:methyltransferase, FxLD system n=1 Tax=Streptomyces sp. PT12 TaxID=1510197 RepID=UPI000DE35FEE|nr:methyltransferase, FxLD system [Streptomyces sp. PT12]RBM14152.1 methyltransferase, FxLD system [Streptomyces sp. PT12]
MNTASPVSASPDALRNRMVDRIVEAGGIRSARVEEAMRTVRRHEHVPAVSVERAYTNEAITIKPNNDGPLPLSCASVPSVVATMLEQLDVRVGDRVLEIGAGTGYNAALLAHLVGPSGRVTTVDIDPDVTRHAREALDATGYDHINVVTRDGALGAAEDAPYNRVIATVGVWDVPAAWWEQLAPGGRLVLPLRWRGQTRSVAFTREDDCMVSDSVELCGFLPMIGQDGERQGHIDDDGHVTLHWDADQPIDPEALRGVLDHAPVTVWSNATVGPEDPFDGVWLRMTAAERGTCRFEAQQAAVDAGLRKPAILSRTPALVEDDSLAYFVFERLPGEEGGTPRFALGAAGYGPAGADLASRLCRQINLWDNDRTVQPLITVYPSNTPGDRLVSGYVIDKPEARLVISYPASTRDRPAS